MVDDAFQPCCPARSGRENVFPEPFRENPPPTMRRLANEPPCDHTDAYFLAGTGQIRNYAIVNTGFLTRSLGANFSIEPDFGMGHELGDVQSDSICLGGFDVMSPDCPGT